MVEFTKQSLDFLANGVVQEESSEFVHLIIVYRTFLDLVEGPVHRR